MAAWLQENLGMSADLSFRIAATLATVVIAVVVRWLIVRWLNRTITDGDVLFRARKAITYITMSVAVFLLTWIWVPFFDDLGTFLGLLVAGLAIALADVFLDLAGWLFIMLRRPFRVGDRIEIDGTAGDVVDVRAFRFTLLEIKSWVDADQSTGRLVHVPNGHLFRHPTANYTEGFFHIWHEMPVLVTFESDWRRAEELIRVALEPLAIAEEDFRREEAAASAARDYVIKFREMGATVYVSTRDSGVLLTARLLVEARSRRNVEDEFWRALLTAFEAEPSVELAYPTVRTYLHDPLIVRHDPA
ncbi:MAG: mechanosensitive ion channel domain-containing protein [Acidimicrobiia bacterium]